MTVTDALDERDRQIIWERRHSIELIDGPRVGDYVDFADDTRRRVAYIWRDEHGEAFSVQTCEGGSFYLGNGYVSMSGSLYGGVKPETLTLTGETAPGSAWIFHHDHHTRDNGVDVTIPFRVYRCSEDAPRS
jgi:hypothetical protein